MPHLLGIDIGTTNVKAAVIDVEDLSVLATADQEYPIHQPQPGYAEQDPEDWWRALIHTTRSALSQVGAVDVRGIGVSGQMHGPVCLGSGGELLRPAIIWADTRSIEQVERLKTEDYSDFAPGPPAVGFMASTLMWLKQYETQTYRRLKTALLPKDYARYRLTGTLGTEPSDAVATWLFDVRAGRWSGELLGLCDLDGDYLPDIVGSADVVGGVTKEAAAALGLPANIPVVAGSADMPAQALGYGLGEAGTGLVIIGTGGQVFYPLSAPEIDPQMRYYVFNYNVPRLWYAQAAILAAGLSLRWLRDALGLKGQADAYDYLSALAGEVACGSDGLLFLPYLAGERSPVMDADACGMFFGLRLHHGQGHLARAVMEGVALAIEQCVSLVGNEASQMILSGGATKSPVWRQILADVLQKPLLVGEDAPYACIGAAVLAGVGAGIYSDIAAACSRLPQPQSQIWPDDDVGELYRKRAALYREMYPLLKGAMQELRGSVR